MNRTAALLLALFGLFTSLYLFWFYTTPGHPIVCLGSGCDVVRTSEYALLLGIPTPAYGVIFYTLLCGLLFGEAFVRTVILRRTIFALSVIGVLVAGAFSAVEAFVIHAWCAWCVAQAIAVTGIFILRLATSGSETNTRATVRRQVAVLAVSVAVGIPSFLWLMRRGAPEQTPPPPTAAQLSERLVRADSHIIGNPNAAVTFVEFADLQCPVCAANYPQVRRLQQEFGSRVRFVFRNFPLVYMHPYAMQSAEAAECAGQQGKFWQMLARIYMAAGDLQRSSLERYAIDVGVDEGAFRRCLEQGTGASAVRRDSEDGHALGVRHTPTYFVGYRRIIGALPFDKLAAVLNEELKAVEAENASRHRR
ncbi:MAG: thioredoxin domain-containing protein [Terriglobales bacterium]